MVAAEQHQLAGGVHRSMAEGQLRALLGERRDDAVMRHPPQRHDRAQARHFGDLGGQEPAAGLALRRRRLVFRRHASDRVGDPAVDQGEAVIGALVIDAAREAEFEQGRVEQVARIVAGEGPPGPVGAAQAGRQADDQQPRVARPEWRDRRIEPGRFARAPRLAKSDQARTERAVPPRRRRCHGRLSPRIRRRPRRRRSRVAARCCAGGIAGCGRHGAAHAARARSVPRGRGRSWAAIRRCP